MLGTFLILRSPFFTTTVREHEIFHGGGRIYCAFRPLLMETNCKLFMYVPLFWGKGRLSHIKSHTLTTTFGISPLYFKAPFPKGPAGNLTLYKTMCTNAAADLIVHNY